MLFYRAYGLRIRSNISLPLSPLRGCTEDAEVDVEVHKAASSLNPEALLCPHHADLKAQSALLFWQNAGRFEVRQGREITVEPGKGVADHLLCPFLLGAALPVLLLQRGLFVLHASAVALCSPESGGAERAVAFLGNSGQGKSTMATALYQRGHRALADDTIALAVTKSEVPLLYPALPHLKLRAPSVEALGEEPARLSRWHAGDDSFVLPLSSVHSHEPAPLKCFYVLEESVALEVEQLPLPEALMSLMQHSYSIGLLPDSEMGGSFEACSQLVQQTPVFKLRRPRNFARLPDVVQLVEEHQRTLGRALACDSNLSNG